MRGMDNILIFMAVIFGFILFGGMIQSWQKHRRDKLKILEEAIRSGNVDPETKRTIIESLHGQTSRMRMMFGVGWVGLFVGVGLLISDERDLIAPGAIVSAVGFALVTLPIAYRELEARRRA